MGLFTRTPPPPPVVRRYHSKPSDVPALLASAKVMSAEAASGEKASKIKTEGWQTEAWNYYDLVGELWYAANFYGGCLSRVFLTVGIRQRDGRVGSAWGDENEDGTLEPLHPWAGQASDLIEDLRSPIGGQPAILKAFGLNLAVAGEAYLLGQEDAAVPTTKRWEVLSVDELKSEGDHYKRGEEKINPKDALVVRVWRPHPRRSKLADSAIRALSDILEELVILTRGVRATATSRLAGAGVYWVPSEIDYPGPDDDTESGEAGVDRPEPFTADLIKAMTTPISDKGSAAAVVPMVVRAAAEHIAAVRHDDFTRSFDSYPSVALRREAVERFAQGIDLPVEIVTGQGGANHWSAWQIDEQTFKAHIEPMLTIICDGLSGGYLVPGLVAMGAKAEEVGDLVVHYDAAELVTHPNQAADAMQAHDRVTIRNATFRRVLGFTEADAPDDEEIAERIAIAQGMKGTSVNPGGGNASPTPAGSPSEVTPGAPSQEEAATILAAMVSAAAEVAIERAIERTGAKVRGRLNGRHDLRAAVSGVEARGVCAQLGPTAVLEVMGRLEGERRVAAREEDLFAGEFAALGRAVTIWAREMGRRDAPEVSGRVVAAVERMARSRLYTPRGEHLSPADFLTAVAVPDA